MQATSLKPENAKALVILLGGIVAIVLVIVIINKTFGGLKAFFSGITDSLGLTDSPENAARKQAVANAAVTAANPNNAWSPQFYKNAPAGSRLFTQSATDDLAAQIWDSVGIFTTDIDSCYSAFKQCSAKTQVSFLADRFNTNYQKDLLSWITLQYTKMGTPDPVLQNIIDYVNSLTNY